MAEAIDKDLLLQAALDGELDAAGQLAFEQKLAEDAALAAEYSRCLALRERLRDVAKLQASSAFAERIAALAVAAETPAARRGSFWPQWAPTGWAPTGIAACLAFLIGSGLTALLLPQAPSEQAASEMQALVSDHVRGMISGQPVDVVSSERHTVKPWFASHTALSPEVVDLKDQGFPLVGGRVDVIGATPVPVLVFRTSHHLVSLAEVPRAIAHLKVGAASRDGLSVLTWERGAVIYVAISDAVPEELTALRAAFHKATGAATN